jgi:hypothetical protein
MFVALVVVSSFFTVTVYVAVLPATTLAEPVFAMLTMGASGAVKFVIACAVHVGAATPLSPMQPTVDADAVAVLVSVVPPAAAGSVVATIV